MIKGSISGRERCLSKCVNRIDEQMYQDKMKYYEHNDRRNSK